MNADAKFDASRLWQADIALQHAVLHLDRTANGVQRTAELDEGAVSSALDDPSSMHRDRRVDQVAAQCSKTRQGHILIRAGQAREAHNVGGEDRGDLAVLAKRWLCRRRRLG